MKTYPVKVRREGKWWMIHVPEIDGLTQARRLGEVEDMARSLISIALDVPPDTFDLAVELEAIEDIRVTERLERLHTDQAALAMLTEKTREEARALARDLAATGVPVRDIGEILSVSFQRAQQLATEPPAAERAFMSPEQFRAFAEDLARSNEVYRSIGQQLSGGRETVIVAGSGGVGSALKALTSGMYVASAERGKKVSKDRTRKDAAV